MKLSKFERYLQKPNRTALELFDYFLFFCKLKSAKRTELLTKKHTKIIEKFENCSPRQIRFSSARFDLNQFEIRLKFDSFTVLS